MASRRWRHDRAGGSSYWQAAAEAAGSIDLKPEQQRVIDLAVRGE
jgi:hypothetical protein